MKVFKKNDTICLITSPEELRKLAFNMERQIVMSDDTLVKEVAIPTFGMLEIRYHISLR